jgi:hypothetical protein
MKAGYRTDGQGAHDTPLHPSEPFEEVDAAATAPAEGDGESPGTDLADAAAGVTELLDGLRDHGWAVLHALAWPDRPDAVIDHVVVGPGGVVVVHVRDWTGTVTVEDGRLRQNGYRRDRELDRASAATNAVARVLPKRHRDATIGLVCLASHDQPLEPTSAGVPVVGRDRLVEVLTSTPARLRADEVSDIVGALARACGPDLVPQQRSSVVEPLDEQAARRPWFPAWAPWRR